VGLRDAISTPAGKASYVRDVFATIADRYDLITVLLSYGQDRRWKQRLVGLAGDLRGHRILDLACGTGDITMAAAANGGEAIGLDLTPRMIELAMARRDRQPFPGARPLFLVGDMSALPFPAESFDIVTTGYGLRNVPNIDRAVAQIARVLRPGGVLLSLDFNRPSSPVVRAAYHAYLSCVGSVLGWVLHRDPNTYRYIPESIRLYPGAERVLDILRAHGFSRARWHRVLGGLMAIHEARKNPAPECG
jgi:demethylmenaquinone methyltransferase/2-methoxy-6-polyprenyl-1,4-benzoquinol methylase